MMIVDVVDIIIHVMMIINVMVCNVNPIGVHMMNPIGMQHWLVVDECLVINYHVCCILVNRVLMIIYLKL